MISDPIRRPPQRHCSSDILRACAPLALMTSAVHHRLDRNTLTNIQRADALGSADLMPADGIHCDVQAGNANRNLSGRLHTIGMQRNARLGSDARDFLNRLDGAYL